MIQVESLSKKHKKQWLLQDVSFQVEPGQVFGLGGPNGSGKTLLLQILAGLSPPSTGTVSIAGHDIAQKPQEAKRRVGYVGVEPKGYGNSLIEEYLEFWAAAHGLSKDMRHTVVEDALALCDLEPVRRIRLADLSAGMRQRVELARAVVHDPPVLLLDGPCQRLDVQGAADWTAMILELAVLGKAIVLASAQLWQWLPMCHQIGLLCSGQMVALGSLEELCSHYQIPYLTVVRFAHGEVGADTLEALAGVVQVLPRQHAFHVSHTVPPEQLLRTLIHEGLDVVEFRLDWQGLEQAFLTASGD